MEAYACDHPARMHAVLRNRVEAQFCTSAEHYLAPNCHNIGCAQMATNAKIDYLSALGKRSVANSDSVCGIGTSIMF